MVLKVTVNFNRNWHVSGKQVT